MSAPWLCTLVGMHHRGTTGLVRSLRPDTKLDLKREPTNPHDRNAIQVWLGDTMLGYVKATDASGMAAEMDAKGITECSGVLVSASNEQPQIQVTI